MGTEPQYRWDRRRKRRASLIQGRDFKVFWGFEIILLIAIFSLWFLFARLVTVYAFVYSPCAEAIFAFGTHGFHNNTAFEYLIWIVILLFGFWLVIGIHFWRTIRRSKSGVVHLILLGSIILLGMNFRMMLVGNNNPPDGSLATHEMVVDESNSQSNYAPIKYRSDEFGDWKLGPINRLEQPYVRYLPQHCVWLDENKIRDETYISIDGYVNANDDEKILLVEAYLSEVGYNEQSWPDFKLGEILHSLIQQNMDRESAGDHLISAQKYRELLPEERERFLQKQKCLKENFGRSGLQNKCTFHWEIDWDAFEAKYLPSKL